MKLNRLKNLDGSLTYLAGLVGNVISFVFTYRKLRSETAILRPGGMGDLILLTIAMEDLHLNFNDFIFFIEVRSLQWAEHLKLKFVVYDQNLLKSIFSYASRFQRVINTEQLFGLSQAYANLLVTHGGYRVGFSTNRGKRFCNQVISYDPFNLHESVSFKLILGGLGALKYRVRSSEVRKHVVVGIAGKGDLSRDLALQAWLYFARYIIISMEVIIVSAPNDYCFAQSVANRYKELGFNASLLRGSFDQVTSAIQSAQILFSVDGGLVHVASYYGVPNITLFTSGRNEKWGSLSLGSLQLYRDDLSCRPCTLFGQVPPCRYNYDCKKVDHVTSH